jgi:hypothetical protein
VGVGGVVEGGAGGGGGVAVISFCHQGTKAPRRFRGLNLDDTRAPWSYEKGRVAGLYDFA